MFTHELVLNRKAVKGSHCCFHLLCTVVLKANASRLVSYKVHTYHYIRVTSIHSRKQLLMFHWKPNSKFHRESESVVYIVSLTGAGPEVARI